MPQCLASGITATLLVSDLEPSLSDTVILTMGEKQQAAAKNIETSLLSGQPLSEELYSEGLSDLDPEFIGPDCDMPIFMVVAKPKHDSFVETNPANIDRQALALTVRTTAKTLVVSSHGKRNKKDIKIEVFLNGELLNASSRAHRKMKEARADREEVNIYSGKRFHRQLEMPLTYTPSDGHGNATNWEDRWKDICAGLRRHADQRGMIDGQRVHAGKFLAALAELPYPAHLVKHCTKPAVIDVIVTAGTGMKNGPSTSYIKSPTALRCVRKEDISNTSVETQPVDEDSNASDPQTPIKHQTKAGSMSTARARLKQNKVVRAAIKHHNGKTELVSETSSPNLLLSVLDDPRMSITGDTLVDKLRTQPTPYHLYSSAKADAVQIHTSPMPDPFVNTDQPLQDDSPFGDIRIVRDSSQFLNFLHSGTDLDTSPSLKQSSDFSLSHSGQRFNTKTAPNAMIPSRVFSSNSPGKDTSETYQGGSLYSVSAAANLLAEAVEAKAFLQQSPPKRKRQVSLDAEKEPKDKAMTTSGKKVTKSNAAVVSPQCSRLARSKARTPKSTTPDNFRTPLASRSRQIKNYYNPEEITPRQALNNFRIPDLCKDSVVSYAGGEKQRQITKERAGDFAEEVFVIGMRFIVV